MIQSKSVIKDGIHHYIFIKRISIVDCIALGYIDNTIPNTRHHRIYEVVR